MMCYSYLGRCQLSSAVNNLQRGRREKTLDRSVRIDGRRTTWRDWLANQSTLDCKETDAMCEWSRIRSNRMDGAEQREYEARLKAKRLYWINDVNVPKIVYDVATGAA